MPVVSDLGSALQSFVQSNIKKWSEQEVLPEAISESAGMGLPRKFVNGNVIEDEGTLMLTNNWVGENYHSGALDVPLALIFEHGTVRNYPIEPVYADSLHWTTAVASVSILGTPGTTEIGHWAKRVIHPGFPPSLAMQRGHKRGMRRLRVRVARECKLFIQRYNAKLSVKVTA